MTRPATKIAVAESLFDEAESLLQYMRLEEALGSYTAAEKSGFEPDACAGGRWFCEMLLGNFERAWRESDAIATRGRPDPYRFWDGAPFTGRDVVIRCLHGLGDTIQFIRYAPLIRKSARKLIIEAQPTLKQLIAGSDLADEVITWGETVPEWDQQVEVVELPRIFRTTQESIPRSIPYLRTPGVAELPPAEGKRPLRAGVLWAGSSFNPARSVPFELMARIFDVSNVEFYSLQAEGPGTGCVDRHPRLTSLDEREGCLLITAKKVQKLDLVITVDTMMAHLAGALGRRVWTLLPFQCDWRWMTRRDDSPWYPTMRLFRQPRRGEWEPVIERVRAELRRVTAGD